jgi:SAM-dependent methyltransferase
MTRDTDADWRKIGETEPFWGVLTEERFRRKQMDEQAKRGFYASGTKDIDFVLSRIRQMVPQFRPREALDFGCGVGRLTLAMARHAEDVTGVDISPGMLGEARESARLFGVGNVRLLEALPDGRTFDWINSYIVLQHIPPHRGYTILRDLLSRLAPGGICSIQLAVLRAHDNSGEFIGYGAFWSFDGETARIVLDEGDPRSAGTVRMYDYDLNRVLAIMLAEKIDLFGMAPTNHGGHHGVWLFGRRGQMAAG